EWTCPANVAALNNGEWCDADHAEYEARQADNHLNEIYRKLLEDYASAKDQEPWRVAQRAWLKYYEAHCTAVASKGAGAASSRQYVYQTCRADQIRLRTKELASYCERCR